MNWLMTQIGIFVENGLGWLEQAVPDVPPEATAACATIAGATDAAAPLAVFVPFDAIVWGVAVVVSTTAVVVGIRLFRIVVSMRTGGGGA